MSSGFERVTKGTVLVGPGWQARGGRVFWLDMRLQGAAAAPSSTGQTLCGHRLPASVFLDSHSHR